MGYYSLEELKTLSNDKIIAQMENGNDFGKANAILAASVRTEDASVFRDVLIKLCDDRTITFYPYTVSDLAKAALNHFKFANFTGEKVKNMELVLSDV